MKKAFTLLELIIAIVIIGIASAGLPMMLSSANKLEEHTINQDVIFKSTAIMNDIMSRFWDSSMYDQDSAMIVATNSTDAGLNSNPRYGDFARSDFDGRKLDPSGIVATAINSAAASAIDLANDKPTGLNFYNNKFIDESTSDARVRYDIKVGYVSDVPSTTNGTTQTFTWNLTDNGTTDASESTNLKKITITATRTMGSGEIYTNTFSYFASNIGSQELKTK